MFELSKSPLKTSTNGEIIAFWSRPFFRCPFQTPRINFVKKHVYGDNTLLWIESYTKRCYSNRYKIHIYAF